MGARCEFVLALPRDGLRGDRCREFWMVLVALELLQLSDMRGMKHRQTFRCRAD